MGLATDLGEELPVALERMSPHPEDTPAPLFSRQPNPSASSSAEAAAAEPAAATAPETQSQVDGGEAANQEQEVGSTSIIVDHGVGGDEDASVALTTAPKTYTTPVVGDYLKLQFVDHRVVPTILDFFFKYPWNNFLHNVVYDIVQQVFNGPMDRSYNPTLAISLFEAADITAQIIKGQQASEESQEKNKTRMGYMGHLTLIAEEVVKFTERHPPELLSETVVERVMAHDWINYVEGALAETRERDNAILGGVRPEVAMSNRAGASGLAGLSGLGSLGLGGSSGNGSSALAEAGLNGGQDMHEQSGNGIGPFAISAGTLMSGFGSSSDEEDDEEQESEEDVNNEVSYPLQRCPSNRQSAGLGIGIPQNDEAGGSSSGLPTSAGRRMNPFRTIRRPSGAGHWVIPRAIRQPIEDDDNDDDEDDDDDPRGVQDPRYRHESPSGGSAQNRSLSDAEDGHVQNDARLGKAEADYYDDLVDVWFRVAPK